MTITIDIPPETERALESRARRCGQDVPAYLGSLIEWDLKGADPLDEIMGPFRRQVEESGISDDKLDQLIDEARSDVYRAKRARAAY